MLHINFGHVGSISTSCEEFGVWGKTLMVSAKVEGLPTWTKDPQFPPPQPLNIQTTKSPHLAIHYPPLKTELFLLVDYFLYLTELKSIIFKNNTSSKCRV